MLFLLFVGCNTHNKEQEVTPVNPIQKHLIGFYEFQAKSGGRNQYILLDTLKGKYYGIYYRTESKRGKGQWYYANSLANLTVNKDEIRFELGARKLFRSKQVTPGKKIRSLPEEPSSINNETIKFNGMIQKGLLQLSCESAKGDCPAESMVFRKIPLPQ